MHALLTGAGLRLSKSLKPANSRVYLIPSMLDETPLPRKWLRYGNWGRVGPSVALNATTLLELVREGLKTAASQRASQHQLRQS